MKRTTVIIFLPRETEGKDRHHPRIPKANRKRLGKSPIAHSRN